MRVLTAHYKESSDETQIKFNPEFFEEDSLLKIDVLKDLIAELEVYLTVTKKEFYTEFESNKTADIAASILGV